MKKHSYLTIIAFLLILLLKPIEAKAVFIVDTGEPPGDGSGGIALVSDQWGAAEIVLTQPYTVTSMEGWMSDFYENPTLTLALYGDGGSIPDVTSEIFSQVFTVPPNPFPHAGWHGVSGLNLNLLPGEYWVAFEVRPGDTYSGALPQFPPSPLANYAFTFEGLYRSTPDTFGVRVDAESVVIPEPSTLLLLTVGVFGLAVRRKLF